MKYSLVIFLLYFLCLNHSYAQYWDESEYCNINVNDPTYPNAWRKKTIDATFRYEPGGRCSGVLINRNVSDGNIGFYFITARHCLVGDDLNQEFDFYFNYQSPDENNGSTHQSNEGRDEEQSESLSDNKHQYHHESKINVIGMYTWGDFALCEIETPLPPHFNVSYAGWNPNFLNNPGTITGFPVDYVGIHHPMGDIKKISGTTQLITLNLGISSGCYTATSFFDALFGTSTQVICNYTDIPWYNVILWNYGTTEPGSSGSGLFNSINRLIGALHFGAASCSFSALDSYGKFHANYHNQAVRNVLNPPNERIINLIGMPGRKITCYDNLTLPGGASNADGYYFPAEHYQDENKITLSANNDITTNKNITVFNGADYEFTAGNSITLGPGFRVHSGANFRASIQGCPSPKKGEMDNKQQFIDKLRAIKLPEYEKPEEENNKKVETDFIVIRAEPNPASQSINLKFVLDTRKSFVYQIFNTYGQLMFSSNDKTYQKGISTETHNISDWANGMYIVKVITDKKAFTKQFVKMDSY